MSDRAMLLRETALSVVINAAVSVAFFVLIFGVGRPVELAAFGADFFAQAFMIALMSSLVPMLLLRRRLGGPIGRILMHSVASAGAALIVAGGGAWLVCLAAAPGLLGFGPALAIKAIFGSLLAAVVTIVSVRATLSSARSGPLP